MTLISLGNPIYRGLPPFTRPSGADTDQTRSLGALSVQRDSLCSVAEVESALQRAQQRKPKRLDVVKLVDDRQEEWFGPRVPWKLLRSVAAKRGHAALTLMRVDSKSKASVIALSAVLDGEEQLLGAEAPYTHSRSGIP